MNNQEKQTKMIQLFGRSIPKDLLIFLIISILLGITQAVDSSSMANRLHDLGFDVMKRSILETPRELPGLLTVVMFGMLNALGDIRIAALANMLGGVGLLLFGNTTQGSYGIIVMFLVVYSVGQHLYLPLQSSLAMSFAKGENFGKRLGQVQGLGSLSVIIASAVLYLLYKIFDIPSQWAFTAGALAMFLSGVLFLFINENHIEKQKQRFVFRKEYRLYYILCIINGARKQITITFVPWLIIDIFDQPVSTMTLLFFIVCTVNIFFKPWLGGIIDTFGSKFALQAEAVLMAVACVGFAFSKTLFSPDIAFIIASSCYVLDNLLLSASMARAAYVRKIAITQNDVSKTLSMGQSIDHIISMFIPLLAGYIWYTNGATGYIYVFLGGILLAVLNFVAASRLKKV